MPHRLVTKEKNVLQHPRKVDVTEDVFKTISDPSRFDGATANGSDVSAKKKTKKIKKKATSAPAQSVEV